MPLGLVLAWAEAGLHNPIGAGGTWAGGDGNVTARRFIVPSVASSKLGFKTHSRSLYRTEPSAQLHRFFFSCEPRQAKVSV